MKRMMMTLAAVWMGIALCSAAMSNSRVRKETRFLTDKMAYELNLTQAQYNDVYEINFDFINSIRYCIDDAMRGYEWALDRYYDCLDLRNDDLRWVLSRNQYNRFLDRTYFCRPVYATSGGWGFRIYITYSNHNHFYFPKPAIYHTYCGGHHHRNHQHPSYYKGRYDHPNYTPQPQPRKEARRNAQRADFGRVTVRPNSKLPDTSPNHTRPTSEKVRGDRNERRTPASTASPSEKSRKESKRTAGKETQRETRRKTPSVKPAESRSNTTSDSQGRSSSRRTSERRN